MSLVSQNIKNLKGGISQQPDILRYPDQGAQQVNAFSSEVEGLIKRPPTVSIARLGEGESLGENPMCHLINRDSTEQYITVFDGSDVKVIDLRSGSFVPVTSADDFHYASCANPREDIRCVTVADYTFVVNTKVSVLHGTATAPQYHDPKRNCLVVVSGGQYSRTFEIWINGSIVATYKTPDGSDPSHGEKCDIQYILEQLRVSFNSMAAAGTSGMLGWSVHVMQGYLWIQAHQDATVNELKVVDGYNGKLAAGIRSDVQKTTELPVYAPANYQIRVSGEASTGQDDYWVRFDAERNVWTEMAAPGSIASFDNATMPHVLIRQFDGQGRPYFEFKPAEWTHRASGDDDTNPFPSFMGEKLTDVFFFRNRLGLLSGENVILSESGAYFNFFPPSVAVSSDSDPIDVAVSANRVSLLKYAIPFAEELLLWADQNQFVLGADGILSPTSVKLDLTTEFDVADNARPYGIGRGVYFASPRASYSSINRYYAVQDVSSVKNAEDVSAHCPRYVPNGIHSIAGSSAENFVSVLTTGAPHCIFVYKFLYLDEQVAQQSWSHWDFGKSARVLACPMIGSTMHILLDTQNGLYLERAAFTANTKDFPNEPMRLYMDRKVEYVVPAGSFNEDEYTTTVHLSSVYGATPTDGSYYAVSTSGATFRFDPPEGGWTGSGQLVFNADVSGQTLYIGKAYEMLYEFSRFLIKQQGADGSMSTEDSGRLQLRRAWVNYDTSGSFEVEVRNQGRRNLYKMTGKRLGAQGMLLGSANIDTGQFRYPIGGNARNVTVTLTSDTPNPVSIIGGGWEGNYVRRSNGI